MFHQRQEQKHLWSTPRDSFTSVLFHLLHKSNYPTFKPSDVSSVSDPASLSTNEETERMSHDPD